MSAPSVAEPLLGALIDAALAGAREVMAVYRTDFTVESKADDSPVSEADRRAEEVIVARLRAAMPEVPIIAEEAVSAGAIPAIGQKFFLVDPLDGTKEFVSRNGEFTVNIGLIEEGAPVMGVVLAPALGLAFAGGRASAWTGAWKGTIGPALDQIREWTAIRTRVAGPAPVAVASRSHSNEATEAALAKAHAGERRSIGSSLKFCLVAEGEADFYPRLGATREWDTAAGDAVLRAAGGLVVTLDGRPLLYGKASAPGPRPYENPNFLAAGDPALLSRLQLTKAA
jgi:3'(2'),5'-bisphosphate nucleotidase